MAEAAISTCTEDFFNLSRNLDFLNLMAYDYHGAWEMKSGHHAPLYRNPLDTGDFAGFNVVSKSQFFS